MRKTVDLINLNKFFFYFILLIFLFNACQKRPQNNSAAEPVGVSVRSIVYCEVPLEYTFPAAILSGEQIDLRTDVSGVIEKILFKEGSYVHKGAFLYDIDKTRYKAAYDQALSQWRISKAQLHKAQVDAERYQNLWKHDAVEKIKLDYAESELQVARASAQAAKANAERVKADFLHARVKAPFSGYIAASAVRLGDMVVSGQTVLTTLVSKDEMLADFFVPERFYKQIRNLKSSEHPDFSLTLPDGSDYEEKGKLKFIENQINPNTGTLRMRVSFPNPKEVLNSGMNVVVKIKQKSEHPVVLIDQKSLRKILNENFVFVVGKDRKIIDKKIEIGPAVGNQQIVEKGLIQGEQVVVEGIQKIKTGDVVQVENIFFNES